MADIVITATGNRDVVSAEQMSRMKHQAIVGNIGHFDNEIDMAGLEVLAGRRAHHHQAAGRRVPPSRLATAAGRLLSEGRLMNLGNATGHPSRS
ncbi:MAG: hypothetical protein R2734_05320 [Nocardioides sp.]